MVALHSLNDATFSCFADEEVKTGLPPFITDTVQDLTANKSEGGWPHQTTSGHRSCGPWARPMLFSSLPQHLQRDSFFFFLCSIFNYLGSAIQVFASASLPWNSRYAKQKAAGFAL